MKHLAVVLGIALCLSLISVVHGNDTTGTASMPTQGNQDSSFRYGGGTLTESELAGAKIWFNATAGNARFFTYVYQQRLGVMIDWYRVLNSQGREKRFNIWGLINDPDCCKPGDPNCPAKNLDETYGFDYCPGDDRLLSYVGKTGYKDPACEFHDADPSPNNPHSKDVRQSPCDLEFGTSTGALGLRKFPNPNFNKDQWTKVNKGRLANWDGYNEKISSHNDSKAPPFSRLMDGSIEPPFRIGMACGACHIAFNPLNPPKDPANPKWDNISGTVGNQYARVSQILGSGMSTDTIEYQVFAHARPGTVDTSAIPTDQVNNPGTMNAIINIPQRPQFEEEVIKWRRTNTQCPNGADERACWCEPGKSGKCWERSKKTESVRHILKGGEDSIGDNEAVQRVYFNIGSCSEEAWVNHLTDMRQVDHTQRNFGQTAFDIGQARRDCLQFRAIEDRLDDVVNFLLSARPTDLYKARGLKDERDLTEQLDKEFGTGSVARGKIVFAQNCARCHSSQPEPFTAVDFRKLTKDTKGKDIRLDWMGNDKPTPVSEVGTHQARALHSNHMADHVWGEYGSETLRARKPDPNIKEPADGGRGYYRNISLLSVWAHAPFMHNNAIGPELCGGTDDPHYHSPYVNQDNTTLPSPPACWPYDPSVKGRYELYKASMRELLYPNTRIPKITMFADEVRIRLLPKLKDGDSDKFIEKVVVFPTGTPSSRIGNFRHKEFVDDLVASKVEFAKLKAKYVARFGPKKGEEIANALQESAKQLILNPTLIVETAGEFRDIYSNSLTLRENEGHRFGEDLSDKDKNALIAFLATL